MERSHVSRLAVWPDRAGAWLDRWYLLLMAPVGLSILALNYHAKDMQGLILRYQDFARIILAGFDPAAGRYGAPTFPMWGYGWLLLLSENKAVLLLLQHAFSLWAVWIFLRVLARHQVVPVQALRLLKGLLVISLPWYAFHSLRWPYSIAVSLLLISSAWFVVAFAGDSASWKLLVLSGMLFGLMLNFRSDYICLPAVLLGIAAAARGMRRVFWKPAILWVASIVLMLIPWALYAKRATGHYLLTSTNSGHVLFIGLGNLPDNKWGITPVDEDPLMQRLVEARFGPGYSSLRYDSDQFLRREYLLRVWAEPTEFARRLLQNVGSVLVDGVYPGEFFERPECQPDCRGRAWTTLRQWIANPVTIPGTPAGELLGLVLQGLSRLMGQVAVFISLLLLPGIALWAWRRRNLLLLLTCSAVLYQAAINTVAYHMRGYTSNAYLFHLINLSLGLSWVISQTVRKRWQAHDDETAMMPDAETMGDAGDRVPPWSGARMGA